MKKVFGLIAASLILSTALAAGEPTLNPHGKLSWECYDCHNTSSWKSFKEPMTFKHDKTGFPLVGGHAKVACASCHKEMEFAKIGSACADCHTDIHRAQFGDNCENCHSPQSWKNNQNIINLHASRGFPLVGVHSVADCAACHRGQQISEYAGTPMDCQGCHSENFAAASDPNHAQLGFKADCQGCHSPIASSWKSTTYQHPGVFLLHGGHAGIGCNPCHAPGYSNVNPECYSCHQAQFDATTDPAHVTFGFPTTCAACHNDVSWLQAPQFDHVQAGNFALNGAHQRALCTSCHVNNQLTGLPLECYGCHQQNFTGAANPNHVQGNYPQTCLICHNEEAWAPATFNHAVSRFPLTGAHSTLQCVSCHASGYQNTPFDCYSCHQTDFSGANNPDHTQNNFDHNCSVCHTTNAWQPASFDHNNTGFPLTGAHVQLQCLSCHASGYQNTPTACYSCHQADFERVTDPNHVTNNFSHDCTQCHTTSNWSGGFNHANLGFVLTGAHSSLQCIACHAGGYQNTPADCYSCHQNAFNGVTDPNHVTNNFDHNCAICHSTTAWNPAIFDHSSTPFPLTGAHVSLQCIACHASGYQNTPADCYSCHQTAFNNVTDPNHVQNNFNHDCTRCHTTAGWSPATFDHSGTRFPLTGAHTSLQCISCHANGYQNTPYDCYSCHQTAFNGVSDPNHVTNNFNHDCTQCHSTTAWNPATFNHNNTRFPLTGAHIPLQCIACHANGYQNTPNDCYSCHVNDYNQVTDPDHVANNFSHDCTQCHNTSSWSNGTFNHSGTRFPLTGAHVSLQCIACHANGYQNTPIDCYSCHQSDYNNATNPNHQSSGFPTQCATCHTTNAWIPSTWIHDSQYFPIYSGTHRGRWSACADCHINQGNFQVFECILCHTHNRSDTDSHHQGVSGYQYNSQACYTCHPRGGGGGLR